MLRASIRTWLVLGLSLLAACGGHTTHSQTTPPPPPVGDAGPSCGDIQTDAANCGSCGHACDFGLICAQGECTCPPDQKLCNGACLDVASDVHNCGECGKSCAAGLICDQGSCACPAPTKMCGDTCLDVTKDDNNCGGCGHQCSIGQHCVASACISSNIKHVVLIVQENHTFDSYFGLYCHAPAGSNPTCTSGPDCCEAAPFTTPEGGTPNALTDDFNTASDPNHSQACELQELDNGAMDGFTAGTSIGSSLCSATCSRPENFALADADAVPTYWSYADSYALADRYFQPIAGGTSSNDMYFAIAHKQFVDNEASPMAYGMNCTDPTGICVNGAATSYDGRVTIGDLLVASGHTFNVYADGYADAVDAAPGCAGPSSDCPYDILSLLKEQSCRYDPSDIPFEYYSQFSDDPKHMKDYSAFIGDAAAGALPSLSYVKAMTFRNEHPKYSTLTRGQEFVEQTVDAVLNSPLKDSTLILLTWDEGGGFFDHVPPPASTDIDDDGQPVPHGTRVPLLAIGPFARKGEISHVVMDHASVVRFLEYNFIGKVGLLGYADAKVNNIGSLLDPAKTGIVVPADGAVASPSMSAPR